MLQSQSKEINYFSSNLGVLFFSILILNERPSIVLLKSEEGLNFMILNKEGHIKLFGENDFYNIIDINTNQEGYVHKSFIKFGDAVERNQGGLFSPDGKSSSAEPELAIYNNTNKTLTLKLNSIRYSFYPQERKTITDQVEKVKSIFKINFKIKITGSRNL